MKYDWSGVVGRPVLFGMLAGVLTATTGAAISSSAADTADFSARPGADFGPAWNAVLAAAADMPSGGAAHQSASAGAGVGANSIHALVIHSWSAHTTEIAIVFLVVLVESVLVTALIMAMRSRRRLIQQLQQEHEDMERTVQKRTAELKALNTRLTEISIREPLTGVYNRRYLDDMAVREFGRCRRASVPLAIAVLDVDYFKQYNDTYGHQMGDECLKQIAEALTQCVHRPSDVVARYGGDEFMVILPSTDLIAAKILASRMVEAVSQLHISHEASPVAGVVTVSLGLAVVVRWTHELESVNQLFELADKQLYAAKEAGRNQFAALGIP